MLINAYIGQKCCKPVLIGGRNLEGKEFKSNLKGSFNRAQMCKENCFDIQSNFYKLNHHYPEKNFKLKKQNLIEFLSKIHHNNLVKIQIPPLSTKNHNKFPIALTAIY